MERGLKTVSDSLDSDLKLKGVMRVGPLAKGLLLRSDAQVQLVLLASEVKIYLQKDCFDFFSSLKVKIFWEGHKTWK